MLRWADENLLHLKWEEIGEHYGRYRLHLPEAERAMARSLERYGQLSPVVVCRRHERYELIDGFKRLGAARKLVQRAMHLTQVTPTSCGWHHRSPLPHAARMAPLGEGTLATGLVSERRRFPETSPGARRVGGDVGHGWVLRGWA